MVKRLPDDPSNHPMLEAHPQHRTWLECYDEDNQKYWSVARIFNCTVCPVPHQRFAESDIKTYTNPLLGGGDVQP